MERQLGVDAKEAGLTVGVEAHSVVRLSTVGDGWCSGGSLCGGGSLWGGDSLCGNGLEGGTSVEGKGHIAVGCGSGSLVLSLRGINDGTLFLALVTSVEAAGGWWLPLLNRLNGRWQTSL